MGSKKKVQTEKIIDGPSGFDQAVKGTIKTINDHGAMPLKLDMTEKLMFINIDFAKINVYNKYLNFILKKGVFCAGN